MKFISQIIDFFGLMLAAFMLLLPALFIAAFFIGLAAALFKVFTMMLTH